MVPSVGFSTAGGHPVRSAVDVLGRGQRLGQRAELGLGRRREPQVDGLLVGEGAGADHRLGRRRSGGAAGRDRRWDADGSDRGRALEHRREVVGGPQGGRVDGGRADRERDGHAREGGRGRRGGLALRRRRRRAGDCGRRGRRGGRGDRWRCGCWVPVGAGGQSHGAGDGRGGDPHRTHTRSHLSMSPTTKNIEPRIATMSPTTWPGSISARTATLLNDADRSLSRHGVLSPRDTR